MLPKLHLASHAQIYPSPGLAGGTSSLESAVLQSLHIQERPAANAQRLLPEKLAPEPAAA